MIDSTSLLEPRDCPICDGEDRLLLHSQRFSEMSAGSLLAGYDVVLCRRCGLAYADKIPSQAAFDAHYRDMSKYEYDATGGKESEYDLTRFQAVAAFIDQVAPERDLRILDIGCSTGRLLALLKMQGYRSTVGLDPSPVCHRNARRLYDVEVITGSLSDVAGSSNSYDLLILSGVLEHIREVKPALGVMRRILSDRGMLFIAVPDATCFASCDDAPFQQFSTEHINFFSPLSLLNVLAAAGFRLVLSRQKSYAQEFAAQMPTVDAVFAKTDSAVAEMTPDTITGPALQEYIRQSQRVDERICRTIEEILDQRRSIVVWGVGTHTLRLLATSRLREAPITAFVDSNPRYHGKLLNGAPIIPPEQLRDMQEPILISSRVFQGNIEEQIRGPLGLKNQLHKLYDL